MPTQYQLLVQINSKLDKILEILSCLEDSEEETDLEENTDVEPADDLPDASNGISLASSTDTLKRKLRTSKSMGQ